MKTRHQQRIAQPPGHLVLFHPEDGAAQSSVAALQSELAPGASLARAAGWVAVFAGASSAQLRPNRPGEPQQSLRTALDRLAAPGRGVDGGTAPAGYLVHAVTTADAYADLARAARFISEVSDQLADHIPHAVVHWLATSIPATDLAAHFARLTPPGISRLVVLAADLEGMRLTADQLQAELAGALADLVAAEGSWQEAHWAQRLFCPGSPLFLGVRSASAPASERRAFLLHRLAVHALECTLLAPRPATEFDDDAAELTALVAQRIAQAQRTAAAELERAADVHGRALLQRFPARQLRRLPAAARQALVARRSVGLLGAADGDLAHFVERTQAAFDAGEFHAHVADPLAAAVASLPGGLEVAIAAVRDALPAKAPEMPAATQPELAAGLAEAARPLTAPPKTHLAPRLPLAAWTVALTLLAARLGADLRLGATPSQGMLLLACAVLALIVGREAALRWQSRTALLHNLRRLERRLQSYLGAYRNWLLEAWLPARTTSALIERRERLEARRSSWQERLAAEQHAADAGLFLLQSSPWTLRLDSAEEWREAAERLCERVDGASVLAAWAAQLAKRGDDPDVEFNVGAALLRLTPGELEGMLRDWASERLAALPTPPTLGTRLADAVLLDLETALPAAAARVDCLLFGDPAARAGDLARRRGYAAVVDRMDRDERLSVWLVAERSDTGREGI